MSSRRVGTAPALAILLVAAVTLSGCGRRGRLEPPPGPNAPPPEAATKSGIHKRTRTPPIVPPSDSFILDPLL